MAYERLVSVPQVATSGQVPTADGTGGFIWQTVSAGGGFAVQDTSPANTDLLWIDTGDDGEEA